METYQSKRNNRLFWYGFFIFLKGLLLCVRYMIPKAMPTFFIPKMC